MSAKVCTVDLDGHALTLEMARQLDVVPLDRLDLIHGRVRVHEHLPHTVLGVDGRDGALVLATFLPDGEDIGPLHYWPARDGRTFVGTADEIAEAVPLLVLLGGAS